MLRWNHHTRQCVKVLNVLPVVYSCMHYKHPFHKFLITVGPRLSSQQPPVIRISRLYRRDLAVNACSISIGYCLFFIHLISMQNKNNGQISVVFHFIIPIFINNNLLQIHPRLLNLLCLRINPNPIPNQRAILIGLENSRS